MNSEGGNAITSTSVAIEETHYDENCALVVNILKGQAAQEFDERKCKLYICEQESYTTMTSHIYHSSVVQVGAASSYLYIGRKRFYIWELMEPSKCLLSNGTIAQNMWFTVNNSAAPIIDEMIRNQFHHHLHLDWFQRAVTNKDAEEEPLFTPEPKILVSLITVNVCNFPSITCSDHFHIHGIVRNSLKPVKHIRISLQDITDQERICTACVKVIKKKDLILVQLKDQHV